MGSLIEQHPHLAADASLVEPRGDICRKFVLLRKGLGGFKAVTKDGVPYKVKSAAVLMHKFRKGCDTYDLLCYPVKVESQLSPTGKGAFVHAVYTIRFVSLADNSYIDVVCNSLGADTQDKAAGKCMTYGWKYAVIYSMLLPDGDVKEEWTDTVDTDDDFQPTQEPSGISKPVLTTYVEKACASTSVQELQAVVTEMRARFNAAEIKSVSSVLVDKKMQLEQAAFIEEQALSKENKEVIPT